MFQLMSKDYFKEIESMVKRIEIIDENLEKLNVVKEEKIDADKVLKKYRHIDKLNRVIMDEFIEKVYIGALNKETNTRNIEIEWNFEF